MASTAKIAFVIDEGSLGWVLEARCRHLREYLNIESKIVHSCEDLPDADAYFFAHYSFLPRALAKNPHIWHKQLIAWYTHPSEIGLAESALMFALNKATKVLLTCSMYRDELVTKGLLKDKAQVVGPSADPHVFLSHERTGNGVVGFCSRYYPRKSPDLLVSIVEKMPHRRFLLLGESWTKYERFAHLKSLPNFEYVEAPYEQYPQIYARMDVFVSPSRLEGGPVPLIEAMMCNLVPVATTTGFAPDIIKHGDNGYLFDADDDIQKICSLIDSAYSLQTNIRRTVEHLSWRNFAALLEQLCMKEKQLAGTAS